MNDARQQSIENSTSEAVDRGQSIGVQYTKKKAIMIAQGPDEVINVVEDMRGPYPAYGKLVAQRDKYKAL